MNKFQAAVIQTSSTDSFSANLAQAEELIAQAAKQGAKLVALPEMFTGLGSLVRQLVETFGQGPIQDFLSMQAKKHHVYLVGGSIPLLAQDDERLFNSALLFSPDGQCIGRYDKRHLFNAQLAEGECYRESDTVKPGDTNVVIETELGKVGLAICYDLRFPEQFCELKRLGAQFIIIPSAFTVTTGQAHWEVLVRAVAVQQMVYVLAPGQVGEHANGRQTYGHSMIVSPWGEILANAGSLTGYALAEIDLMKVSEMRKQFGVI